MQEFAAEQAALREQMYSDDKAGDGAKWRAGETKPQIRVRRPLRPLSLAPVHTLRSVHIGVCCSTLPIILGKSFTFDLPDVDGA